MKNKHILLESNVETAAELPGCQEERGNWKLHQAYLTGASLPGATKVALEPNIRVGKVRSTAQFLSHMQRRDPYLGGSERVYLPHLMLSTIQRTRL